jgi:hypothetical protein
MQQNQHTLHCLSNILAHVSILTMLLAKAGRTSNMKPQPSPALTETSNTAWQYDADTVTFCILGATATASLLLGMCPTLNFNCKRR